MGNYFSALSESIKAASSVFNYFDSQIFKLEKLMRKNKVVNVAVHALSSGVAFALCHALPIKNVSIIKRGFCVLLTVYPASKIINPSDKIKARLDFLMKTVFFGFTANVSYDAGKICLAQFREFKQITVDNGHWNLIGGFWGILLDSTNIFDMTDEEIDLHCSMKLYGLTAFTTAIISVVPPLISYVVRKKIKPDYE